MQVLSRSGFDYSFGGPIGPQTNALKRAHSLAFPPRRLSNSLSDMRTFAVTTSDGLELTLSTAVSGSLFIGRGRSEPPTTPNSRQPLAREPFSQSTVAIETPLNFLPIARPPSPTPTEIDDPDPEEHTKRLSALGIKIRDYATNPSPSAKPAVEVFDYQRTCAEYDFIMMRQPRARPVPGKTLRRLLNLGFISEREQKDRWQQMDWDELRRYDSRTCHYPSRGYPGNGTPVTGVPTMQMRTEWLKQFSAALLSGERVMNRMREAELVAQARAEQWRADTDRVLEEQRAAGERLGSPFAMDADSHPVSEKALGKRRASEDDEALEKPKRQRLSPSPELGSKPPNPGPSPYLSPFRPSPSPLPPGYKEVQIQPSPPQSHPRTPPSQRGSPSGRRSLSRPLSRAESFRQL